MQNRGERVYGKTIKYIRKSKNMTLKEAAGKELSISQLSRFENEKSMIPVDLFYAVLKNLNSNTEEFNYIKNQEHPQIMKSFFKKIEIYTAEEKIDELNTLKADIEKRHPGIYSSEQFLIYFIDSILAALEDRETTAKQHVVEYLMQIEDWGETELRLYAMFGFVLDIETTYFLMNTALNRSKQYQVLPASSKLLHVILMNNFSTFLAFNYLEYAEETIHLFETNYSENTDDLTPHIDFIFNKGLLAFKKKDLEKAGEYCERAIYFCQLFKQKENEKRYTKRYKSWKKNYAKVDDYKEITVQLGFIDLI